MWKKDRFSNNIVQPYIFCPHYTTIRDISLWKTLYLIFSVYTNFCNKTLYHFQFFSIYFSFRTELDPWILKFIFCSAYTESTWILLHKCKYEEISFILIEWNLSPSPIPGWWKILSQLLLPHKHYKLCEGLWSLVCKGRSKRSGIKHWRSPSCLGFC